LLHRFIELRIGLVGCLLYLEPVVEDVVSNLENDAVSHRFTTYRKKQIRPLSCMPKLACQVAPAPRRPQVSSAENESAFGLVFFWGFSNFCMFFRAQMSYWAQIILVLKKKLLVKP
jgi:hypothetical protein